MSHQTIEKYQNDIKLMGNTKKPKEQKIEPQRQTFQDKRIKLYGIFIELFKLFRKFVIKKKNLSLDEAYSEGSIFNSVENFIFQILYSTFQKKIVASIQNILKTDNPKQKDEYLQKMIQDIMEKHNNKKKKKSKKSKGKLLRNLGLDQNEENLRIQMSLILEKLNELLQEK